MHNYMKIFGQNVASKIAKMNLSHRELASKCGVSHTTISMFLRDPEKTDLKISTIVAISEALEIDPLTAMAMVGEKAGIPVDVGQLERRIAALEAEVKPQAPAPASPGELRERLARDLKEFSQLMEALESASSVPKKKTS